MVAAGEVQGYEAVADSWGGLGGGERGVVFVPLLAPVMRTVVWGGILGWSGWSC